MDSMELEREVSMMLMLYLPSCDGSALSFTFQSANVAADWIVILPGEPAFRVFGGPASCGVLG
jgi:hypothetical protein